MTPAILAQQTAAPAHTPASTSALGNVYLFAGRRFDGAAGLYYNRHRYYEPRSGRFLSRDPEGYVDGQNLYAYTRNNPQTLIDPMGTASDVRAWVQCPGPWPGPKKIKMAFDDCSAEKRETVANLMCLVFRAAGRAWGALNRLKGGRASATTRTRFNKYFARGASRITKKGLNKLEEVLWKVYKAFDDEIGFECECACDASTNGYVYHVYSHFWDIHLCPRFFDSLGKFQQVRTLYHELSHRFADTEDVGRHGAVSAEESVNNSYSYGELIRDYAKALSTP